MIGFKQLKSQQQRYLKVSIPAYCAVVGYMLETVVYCNVLCGKNNFIVGCYGKGDDARNVSDTVLALIVHTVVSMIKHIPKSDTGLNGESTGMICQPGIQPVI